MIFIGFPPELVFFGIIVVLAYQTWIHTETIGKLGPLEWVLNTPSHHRVHHGSDRKYLDKNYAGILIIWDRMFGSFQVEEETPYLRVNHRFQQQEPVACLDLGTAGIGAGYRKEQGCRRGRRISAAPAGMAAKEKGVIFAGFMGPDKTRRHHELPARLGPV